MTAPKNNKRARAALVVVLCLLALCLAAGGTVYGLLSRKVKAIQAGADFDFRYTVTSTASRTPALYGVLEQVGATQGTVSGQYAPGKIQFALTSQKSGSAFTRVYIDANETLYDAGQLYTYLRGEIVAAAPLAGLVLPNWSMGSYISQTQLASLLGVELSAVEMQDMTNLTLGLGALQKVTPAGALDGYTYYQLPAGETDLTCIVGLPLKELFSGIFGSVDNEYLHLFKTEFALSAGDVITVRYKLVGGQADVNLALSAKGDEQTILRESGFNVLTVADEADDEVWVEKTFKVSGALAMLAGKEIAMIALHFENAKNLDLYLGEFSITRGAMPTPAAPEIKIAKVLASHYKGVDGKVIFNMDNDKLPGEPVYNLDVNASMFKLYAQQKGGEPQFMGITTSWAGMYYSIPVDADKAQRIRLGVAAVSVDTNSDSDIKWSNYIDGFGDYFTINDVQIDKTTIKPEEDFEISYVDPRHNPADWKLYNAEGEVVKEANNTVKFSVTEGIKEVGAYDLEITESDTTRRFNSYVQITSWGSGALPQIKTLTIDGETVQEGASPIKIEIGKELTLGYTGREADGAASRGVEIDEGWVGGKVAPLDIASYKSFSVSTWILFNSLPGSTAFFSIENRASTWPVNNWGWFWSNVDSKGKLDSYTFRSATAGGSDELNPCGAGQEV